MTTRGNAALLTKAPAGRHICQFHRDADTLSEAVALFSGTGLQRGDAVVIIATPDHVAKFTRDLARMELDPTGAVERGQLVFLDAAETLALFMRDGTPDWEKFRRAV